MPVLTKVIIIIGLLILIAFFSLSFYLSSKKMVLLTNLKQDHKLSYKLLNLTKFTLAILVIASLIAIISLFWM